MKYLKLYETIKSLSVDEICETLGDILLELEDIGYYTKITNYNRKLRIVIELHGPNREFHYNSHNEYAHKDEELFGETILRIKDYMKFEGYLLNNEDIKKLPVFRFTDVLPVCTLDFEKYKKKYANLFNK